MFRRRSLQPSRRAVLHVQAAGDPAVPADLADWFTERAFHFYLAGLRLPGRLTLGTRPGPRPAGSVSADLDAACAQLRQTDGMRHVIVTAQGRGALAAALWSGAQPAGAGADALVLYEPELPARPALSLAIPCPVLVVTGGGTSPGASRRGLRPRRTASGAPQLGGHVTWLQLADARRPGGPGGDGRQVLLDELGRWLGAYMYGQVRDQLL